MMKKTISIFAVMFIILTACSSNETESFSEKKKIVTFSVKGNFEVNELAPFTRSLTSEGKEMTDIWVIDTDGDGSILQTVHQQKTDSKFGSPALALSYGNHVLYFCASRGMAPTLNGTMLRWEKVLDTFWAKKALTIDNETAESQSVELARIVTRLKVTVLDGVPSGAKSFNVIMRMVKEIDLRTGLGTLEEGTVPFAMTKEDEGKTGIEYGVFSLCPSFEEWMVDVSMRYDNNEAETVIDVPFKMNRETKMKGNMNSRDKGFTLSLNTTWDEAVEKDF